MKLATTISTSILAMVAALAETSIDPSNSLAYSPNAGWIQARGDVVSGAVLGEYFCSGFLWGANVGWVNLGSGAPANGVRYGNDTASDFGVNLEGDGSLRGLAYGANIGWIRFEETGDPRVDLATGDLSGHAWSANTGWISLSNSVAHVRTQFLQPGVDSDLDGIADAWELSYTNSLSAFTAAGDADGDGFNDAEEHLADTSPVDPADQLRIIDFLAEFPGGGENATVVWTSKPSRNYSVESRNVFDPVSSWADATPVIRPDPGPETSRSIAFPFAETQRYFRVRAVKPLSP